MIMKLTTSLAFASLCMAGAACSQPKSNQAATTAVESETVAVEDEYTGSLNLNLPSTSAANDAGSGILNLRIGQSSDDDGLLIGSGGFGGGRFEDAPALGLNLPGEGTESASFPATQDEDDVIRLPQK